jgi:para-nitrobenzyl esterase
MNEDCLYLNVWTPAVDDARRPVMVWLHGGAFVRGSGSASLYDGASFARDDVVLVTMNYRLGALGFLYLDELFDDAGGTGNLGLLDQIAALEWVRDNIASFGGDPDNVTVFGESAGGMSVGTLLGTPAASGLFHRAIAGSGAAHYTMSAELATGVAQATLEHLAVTPGDWDSLRSVPVEQLVATAMSIATIAPELASEVMSPAMYFRPTVDGSVLHESAIDAVAAASDPDIDLLVGFCAEEHRFFFWGVGPAGDRMPDPDIDRIFTGSGHSRDAVLEVYAGDVPREGARSVMAAIWTDLMYRIPAVRIADAHRARGGSVRMFRFDYHTSVVDGELGACHGLELPFVFDTLAEAAPLVGDDAPPSLAQEVHGAWIRFARSGDPNGGELPSWPTYDDTRRVMNFDVVSRVLEDPDGETRRLWDRCL